MCAAKHEQGVSAKSENFRAVVVRPRRRQTSGKNGAFSRSHVRGNCRRKLLHRAISEKRKIIAFIIIKVFYIKFPIVRRGTCLSCFTILYQSYVSAKGYCWISRVIFTPVGSPAFAHINKEGRLQVHRPPMFQNQKQKGRTYSFFKQMNFSFLLEPTILLNG